MDQLCGLGSLQVVYHRFSDGVQVVRCVLDFFKAVSEVEQSYSTSISRLVRSSAYTFHSNILMQWLGSEPYEEIGTVKHCWQRLGSELSLLADHHANKAEGYLAPVRIQLLNLLPKLEEMRLKLKNKIQQLRTSVEVAEKIHSKEKQKYVQLGDNCLKLRGKLDDYEGHQTGLTTANIMNRRLERKEALMTREMELQEKVYQSAHSELVQTYENFKRDTAELYKEVENTERERVKTLKESLQIFTKTLSNTAPAYLEGMSRIVVSVDEINATSDIDSFVDGQQHLMEQPIPPVYEQHPASQRTVTQVPSEPVHPSDENDSMFNGNRTPSLRSQRSVSTDSIDDEESESDDDKGQSSEVDSRKGDTLKEFYRHRHSQEKFEPNACSDKPSVRPKPAIKTERKETNPALDQRSSSSDHVSSSSDHMTRSSSHVSSSSSHVSSSSSHVSRIIERIEVTRQHPNVTDNKHTKSATRPKPESADRTNLLPTNALPRLPSVGALDRPSHRDAESARPRTRTVPSVSRTHRTGDPELMEILERLQTQAQQNDCYGLLGVTPDASVDELTKARRDKSRVLHPDHFARQPERKIKAEEQLSLINQIFQDVLKNHDTRSLYDKLCHFRLFYDRIPDQLKGLEKAQSKLEGQYKLMKKAQFPLPMLEEVQLAVELVQVRISKLSTES